MTVVHSAPALHTTHRSTQECLEAYARTEENPVLLGQALDEYTNIYLQPLEPHRAHQLAPALAAGCTRLSTTRWKTCSPPPNCKR